MLGTFGFSYIGLIYLLMLWIPNSLWARRLPEGYDPGRMGEQSAERTTSPSGENKMLLVLGIGHIGIHLQHIMDLKKVVR